MVKRHCSKRSSNGRFLNGKFAENNFWAPIEVGNHYSYVHSASLVYTYKTTPATTTTTDPTQINAHGHNGILGISIIIIRKVNTDIRFVKQTYIHLHTHTRHTCTTPTHNIPNAETDVCIRIR